MLHNLAAVETIDALTGSLYTRCSWDGYIVQQVIAHLAYSTQAYYYQTADGSELDLVLVRGDKPILGIEIKYTNAHTLSRGSYIPGQDLGNIPLVVVTPSAKDYRMDKQVQVCYLTMVWHHLSSFNL